MEIEKSALVDQILFEDEEMSSQPSGITQSTAEELINKKLEGAEYYFTEESFSDASKTLRSILADYAPKSGNYPDSLKKLLCFHYIYPIYKKRSSLSWTGTFWYMVVAVACWFITDFCVGIYAKSGLILRLVSFGFGITATFAFGYAIAAALTIMWTYLQSAEARMLFQKKAQYNGQGGCVYKGKTKDGLDKFSSAVRQPLTPPSLWKLIKSGDLIDEIQDSIGEMIKENMGAGICFAVLGAVPALWMLLSHLSWYGISLIDFFWIFW